MRFCGLLESDECQVEARQPPRTLQTLSAARSLFIESDQNVSWSGRERVAHNAIERFLFGNKPIQLNTEPPKLIRCLGRY